MRPAYVKTKLQTLITVSKIVTIHYYEFDRRFVFGGESHDFWELVYVDKGQVCITRDDEEIIVGAGEIVFHRPDEFHAIKALDSEPNFFVVSFECHSPAMRQFERYRTRPDKTLGAFISSILREAEKTYVIPKNDTELHRLVRKESAPPGGEQLIKTYLEQLLIFLFRGIDSSETALFPSRESMENHLVESIKAYVDAHAEETVRLDDLCREFSYSKSYLCRLFLEQTGETIAAYAVRRKIHLAKRLIRENTMNFTQIAARLSFESPQYFARVFRRVTGMTPTEFKRTLER